MCVVVQVFFIVLISLTTCSVCQRMMLNHWMRDLPPELKDIPLIYLAIPGSHDSMTYGITRQSALAPDAEPILHKLYPIFKGTMIRWTVTQSLDAMEQLRHGIRYLDLRLATKTGSNQYYFTHGLYAEEISKGLEQVRAFVDTHPGEIVILDFQHFYGFAEEDHERLTRFIKALYNTMLVPRSPDLATVTINSLIRLRQQVIVIYRHRAVYAQPEFWQPQNMPSPWPRQTNATGLVEFLQSVRRHPGSGFVHQAVLTPTMTTLIFKWRSTLKEKCAVPVIKDVLPVIEQFSPGEPKAHSHFMSVVAPVNVVIADFIELDDDKFPRTIINLNKKLLKYNLKSEEDIYTVQLNKPTAPICILGRSCF